MGETVQFTIVRTDIDLQAEWDHKTILFDTKEEAEGFIKDYPKFFVDVPYIIEDGIYSIDNSVNWKDVPQEAKDEEKETQSL